MLFPIYPELQPFLPALELVQVHLDPEQQGYMQVGVGDNDLKPTHNRDELCLRAKYGPVDFGEWG